MPKTPMNDIRFAVDALEALRTRVATSDELDFIGQIKPDGSGVISVTEPPNHGGPYYLVRLSIRQGTYIAHGFNSFVVRRKENEDAD